MTLLLTSWPAYSLVAVGIVALWLMQSAFSSAPLHASLPGITAAEPVSGIVLGVVAFREKVPASPLLIALQVAGLIALVAGVILVARSPVLASLRQYHGPGEHLLHPETLLRRENPIHREHLQHHEHRRHRDRHRRGGPRRTRTTRPGRPGPAWRATARQIPARQVAAPQPWRGRRRIRPACHAGPAGPGRERTRGCAAVLTAVTESQLRQRDGQDPGLPADNSIT